MTINSVVCYFILILIMVSMLIYVSYFKMSHSRKICTCLVVCFFSMLLTCLILSFSFYFPMNQEYSRKILLFNLTVRTLHSFLFRFKFLCSFGLSLCLFCLLFISQWNLLFFSLMMFYFWFKGVGQINFHWQIYFAIN